MAHFLPGHDILDRPSRPPCPDAEQILVWAIRRWHLQGAVSREIEVGFLNLCGLADVETALLAFDRLLALLARDGRRPLTIGGSRGAFSLDERSILLLIALHQHGAHDHRRALLRWLVPDRAAESASYYSGVLAEMLKRAGQILPKP